LCRVPTAADRATALRPAVLSARLTPLPAAAHRATYQHDTATIPLAVPRDADAVHCFLSGSAPGPTPVAAALLARGRAPRLLHSRRPAPQTATLPACAIAAHQPLLLVSAAPRAARQSQ